MKKPQLYQVNSVSQINPGKISEPLKKRNPEPLSEPKIQNEIKSNN